jgi:hypothetical protein
MKEANTEREFNSKKEAEAFVAGVQYVNDSAITVMGIIKRDNVHVVFMYDEDKE